ncbi:hypothetical protein K7B10_39355 [Streptomyces flavotricini]|uniref:Uncharacterized protein n=1 Tax=Streptomyces flavotricini TaxID=66888 RepID=A0ABS8EHY2_9ACTN|nr:hypothetical protein [Streptomyces flavotricini]MCC0100711.1 hypothetical protein [Streptomyces flavotricini]
MIRAGRTAVGRRELAGVLGLKWSTFDRTKPHTAADFPLPVSSEGALVLLWDLEQVEAHRDGRPQPVIPAVDREEDLLDRREAALLLDVKPRSVDSYKTDPGLADHVVVVGGVEHWPRAAVLAYAVGRGAMSAPSGRPKGSGDMVPRDLLPGRIAELLDANPAVTAAHAVDVLGISTPAAQRHLQQERAARIVALMRTEPGLDAEGAAERLGYPPAVRRAALKAAQELYEAS